MPEEISLKEYFEGKLVALATTTELARSALAVNVEASRVSLERSLDLSRLASEKLMAKLEADIRELREDRAADDGGVGRTQMNITTVISALAALGAIAAIFFHH
jgi:hypothetical protein